MPERFAIIMAGGSGERFWPLSRQAFPKQFLALPGRPRSLLGEAVERAVTVFGRERVVVVTNPALESLVREHAPELPSENVWSEPDRRNTAGCLTYAMARLSKLEPSTVVAVLTADHAIQPPSEFSATIERACVLAEAGWLTTIGIHPDRAETGFGYIEPGEALAGGYAVRQFHEKPDLATAERYLAEGTFLWNSGMFFWSAQAFSEEIAHASPAHADALRSMATALGQGSLDKVYAVFRALPNVSIDYALMEKARRVAVVPASFSWDDVGSWDAWTRYLPNDLAVNATEGNVTQVNSQDCLVVNRTAGQVVTLAGASNLIIVATDDAILVCPRDRAQSIKELVARLRDQDSPLT